MSTGAKPKEKANFKSLSLPPEDELQQSRSDQAFELQRKPKLTYIPCTQLCNDNNRQTQSLNAFNNVELQNESWSVLFFSSQGKLADS